MFFLKCWISIVNENPENGFRETFVSSLFAVDVIDCFQ